MKNVLRSLLMWLCTLLVFLFPLGAIAIVSEECQDCHGDMDTVGEELFINVGVYDNTAHAEMGCLSCHESVGEEHPDDGVEVSKANCLDCHAEIEEEHQASAHGGNATCGDCHNPHRVHGLTEVSGYDLNQQCANCHQNSSVVESHSEWLPQADLHVAKLPCISCHTASEDYVIILYIIQQESEAVEGDFELSDHADLQTLAGDRNIQSLIDLNQDNFVSLAELRTFNRNPGYEKMRLEATLTPKIVSHSVQTLDNRWDCSFCHTSGTEKMQTSFIALPNAEGTFSRIEVERGAILKALNGTPDFYMMGTTRSASLNIIGLMIIIGGLLMPIGHGTLRFLTRKNRQH
ncbi:cytochrome C [Malonomonas rubra]|uniref:cytochrome C n=1 Tax=Malonomonas rubra TaxID=57040 RepID=UPI0026ED9008|nr:cytochrome C [Malonomonas rubra]